MGERNIRGLYGATDIFREVDGFGEDYFRHFLAGMNAVGRLLAIAEDHDDFLRAGLVTHFLLDINNMTTSPFPQRSFQALDTDTYLECQYLMNLNYLLKVPLGEVFRGFNRELSRVEKMWQSMSASRQYQKTN